MLAIATAACADTNDPTGFVFQYQIGLYGCGADCSTPGTVGIDTVHRGDTVWLRHDVQLLQTTAPNKVATLRPACAQNVIVRSPVTNVDTVPTPTCPDSLVAKTFALGDTILRFNAWRVDSALAPGPYQIVGRVMVQPRIEPQFVFIVQ